MIIQHDISIADGCKVIDTHYEEEWNSHLF
jgi:hypothetical protein